MEGVDEWAAHGGDVRSSRANRQSCGIALVCYCDRVSGLQQKESQDE